VKEVESLLELIVLVFNLLSDAYFYLRRVYEILIGRSEDSTILGRRRH
jgi:hypothetical protein